MERETLNPSAFVLHDGHAGNRRQALALAAALGLPAREIVLAARAPWRWLAPRKPPFAGELFANACFGAAFAAALQQPPRIAIGCGRQAALATRLLGERGARAVQILDPRIDTRHWNVVITPEHDGRHGDNVIALQGSLHPVNDEWLHAARARFERFAALPEPRTALLLGGDSKHWRFDAAAFETLATQVLHAARRDGGSVLVSASRRTPRAIVESLPARFRDVPHCLWRDERDNAAFDGDNPYPGLLAWADRIVCTPDSVNMISEACATRAPVFVFDAQGISGRPRAFLEALRQRGRIRELEAALVPFPVEPLRETARVAAEVGKRLGL